MRDVVIANFNRQHSFQAAVAADGAGRLLRFIAPALKRNSLSADVLAWATSASPTLRRQVGGRLIELSHDASLRSTWALDALVYRVSTRYSPDTVRYLHCELFDRRAASLLDGGRIFHGFEQCAAVSLARASNAGMTAILDQSIIAWPTYSERELAAFARHDVTLPVRPPLFQSHVERKADERRRADYFIAGLADVRDSLTSCGVSPDQIFVLPYGATPPAGLVKVDRPPQSGTLRLLFVGHQNWVKGLPDLLNSLAPSASKVELIVVGRHDPSWEPVIRSGIQNVTRGGGTVRVLGTLPQVELLELYRSVDAFVFPSLIGGIGLATLEAMMAGLPVVVSDPDVLLRPGEDCLVADPLDTADMAAAIGVLRSAAERRRLGDAARHSAERFSWTAYAEGLAEVYSIAARGGPATDFTAPSLQGLQ